MKEVPKSETAKREPSSAPPPHKATDGHSKATGGQGKKSETALREETILEFWLKNDIFKKSLERSAPKGDYVFYDGPPFATGLPHYGHLLQSAVKDVIPRYKTMQGFHVERQWGWDCHGLPIENIVEKEIGTKSKKDIVAMGVKKFNDLCRERIFTFIHEWERIIPRFGRWADMENPYRTMDFAYMESEWWAFKKLYDDGLIYESYRSMHICPRCETTLSQGEVADGYKDVKDISVTVKFKVKNPEKLGLKGEVYLLAWTTTPWTLPGNVALAVGADITYALTSAISSEHSNILENVGMSLNDDEQYIVALERVPERFEIKQKIKGNALVGLEYEPLFDYYSKDESLKNRENGWKVYAADFVTTETGTGIVHIAPAFGEDDMALGKEKNLPFVQHVNMDGTFRPEVADFAGIEVKPQSEDDKVRLGADIAILKYLQEHGTLFLKENITHSYPHCWRCDTPLLNYATSSWFVAVTKIKDKLLKTAENIEWSPAHIKDGRFGEWLKGARDWSISRQRFWANTIPIWRCEKCKAERVFGSALELEKASGTKVTDLHKDVVDEITVSCECGGKMKRIPDVLDTWFDSGSVPFAILHYPKENEATLKKRVPADFIAEAQDQCRAWFYYQHVLMGALFDKEAFKHCIVTGIVMAEDGKKMSKKLNNYPDPMEVVDKYGADALRLYLLSSPVVQAENLCFAESGVNEVAKKNIGRLNNVLAFYKLYENDTPRDYKSTNILDRWILTRLAALIGETTEGYEKYQLDKAVRPLALFIDDLSVWYLRRSRVRIKEDGADKKAALATLRYVLHTLSRVIAPSMPFLAEHLFQDVREEEDEESVHLASWPEMPKLDFDAPAILAVMMAARGFVTMALMQRSEAGIKVRQPLAKLTIKHKGAEIPFWKDVAPLIADEVNVKEVVLESSDGGTSVVSLDIELTPELKEEGIVRDVVRLVQDARKAAKMRAGERGSVSITVAQENRAVIEKNLDAIQKATNTKISLKPIT
ncbi:MAG: isoleucine--tRNA ligase [bacterium]|nr:isoleucine--tRNA ligase [bacterium]